MLKAIQEKVTERGSVNKTDAYGTSLLFEYLEKYYQRYERDAAPPAPPAEIIKGLEWFLSQGADVSLGRFLFPLVLAVCHLDVFMTEWLLSHGADPNACPEDEVDVPNYCLYCMGNHRYLSLREEDFPLEEQVAVKKILDLLQAYGVRGSWQGITLNDEGVRIEE